MSDDVDDKLEGTAKRLLISVPEPLARINLGAPWQDYAPRGKYETDGVAKFGYPGVSIQAAGNLFFDANKSTLFQTSLSYMGQVGGMWLQYSNSHQFIASRANATVAVDDKLLLATGAGHGQITSLDHGKRPRMVPYNNLNLHYRVEEIQNGLSEFFTGRRTRETPSKFRLAPLFQYNKSGEYDRSKPPLAAGEGFWDVLDRAGDLLGVGLPTFRGAHGLFPRTAGAEYGYSGYFSRFDPYAKKKPQGWKAPFIMLRNLLVELRRFADVVAKLGEAITNLPVIRQAFALVDSVENMLVALDASLRVVGTIGLSEKFGLSSETGDGVPFNKQVLDELDSGVLARFSNADATYGSRNATLSTGDGPWTVPAGGYLELRTSAADDAWRKSRVIPGQAPELVAQSALGPLPATARASTITLAPSAPSRSTTVSTDAPDVTALVTAINQLSGAHVLLDPSAQLFRPVAEKLPDGSATARLTLESLPPLATELVVRSTVSATLLGLGLIDETEAAAGTAAVSLHAPFEAPLPIAQELLEPEGSVTIELRRETRSATISWGEGATVSGGAIVQAINAVAERDALVPKGVPLADTSGLSLRLTPLHDTTISFESTGDAAARLGFSDTSSQPAAVVGSGPLTEGWGANPWIVVKTETGEAGLVLGPHNASDLATLVAAINAAADDAVASGTSTLKLESPGRGSGSFVELRADSARTLALLGFAVPDVPVLRQEGEDVSLSAAQLKELLEQGPFGNDSSTIDQVTVTHQSSTNEPDAGSLELESTASLSGDTTSYLEARGPLAALLSGTKDEVKTVSDKADESIKKFHAMWFELNKLSEDSRNLLRPVSHFMNDVVDALNKTEQALEGAAGAVLGSRFIPDGPPTAMGLISKGGITLGTPEKVVGAAGKGFYFVADGGTGQRDVKKFVERGFMGFPMERLISNFMSNSASGIGDLLFPPKDDPPPDKENHAGGGFHVISNSSASLVSRTSVDLLAVGSEKKGAKVEGAGIARIAATHSVEVAGHRSVRIAATGSSSKAANPVTAVTPDTKGGLVEVLGSRLVLGATRGAGPLKSHKHVIGWPLNASKKLSMEVRDRQVSAPTETIALAASESTEITVAPYTLTMKTDGVYLGGPSVTSQTVLQEHTQKINADHDLADATTQARLLEEQEATFRAAANAQLCLLQDDGQFEGKDAQTWNDLADSHRAMGDRLQKMLQASIANRAAALQAVTSMKYSPALMFSEDEIVLGFKVDAGAVSKWGPRIHIKPDQLLVAMGATVSQPDAQHASLLLKAKQVEITPTVGQVKLKIAAQGAKIQAGPQSFVEWTAAGASGANVKKI